MLRPRYIVGYAVLLALVITAALTFLTNPVRRDRINPVATNYRINVNTADPATLALLSGISLKIGGYIVEHREKHGPFRTLADLDEVNRLGPVTIQKIAPYISFK